jgi:3-dehydroquinate synthase
VPIAESAVPTVAVQFPGHRYDVHVEPGLLRRSGSLIRSTAPAGKAMVVTDDRVGPLHLPALQDSLRSAGYAVVVAVIPGGEPAKSLESLVPVFDTFLTAGMDRATPVIALGGGIVGDMAGFVAATILRGVPFVQIPTTLLAMVDASVGGKTGVNHQAGKNLIGAFHHPVVVLADPDVLATLPAGEFVGGLAECIKHEVIADPDGFARLESGVDAVLSRDPDVLTALIAHNVKIKAGFVEADPAERGVRAHLNFGHTFGHAIEKSSGFQIAHGPAVAVGMTAACRLAADLGMIPPADGERVIRLIRRTGLPTTAAVDPEAVVAAMAFDKKVSGTAVRFVLPDRIGHAVVRDDVPAERVRRAVRSISG